METSLQEIREYCRRHGYDYDKLKLSDEERAQLHKEALSCKDENYGEFIDGLLAFPRYEWREAMLNND